MNKAVFYFQLKFWAAAALLLFLYGLSYGHWEIALLRNLYLPVIGFALSTCMVPLYSRIELVWDYRSVVTVALVCSVAALVTALVVNPITFALLGEKIATLPRTEFLTDMLYFALFFVVWTLLYLYFFREHQSPAPRPSLIVESKGEIRRLDLDDLGCRRVTADERDHLLHPMEGRENERHSHIVVALLQLLDELPLGGILEHDAGSLQILRDVVQ